MSSIDIEREKVREEVRQQIEYSLRSWVYAVLVIVCVHGCGRCTRKETGRTTVIAVSV